MNALSTDLEIPSRDPSRLSWPPTLPIELALRIATPAELREEYGYTEEDWAKLRQHPLFLEELAEACKMVRKEGMSFQLKAGLQADALLARSWAMIHDDKTPASVRADLVKSTVRWAGYDNKNVEAGAPSNALNIQINFSGEG